MTDNEVIKALECCRDSNCNECPIEGCTDSIIRNALALIKRQKAEIELLKKAKADDVLIAYKLAKEMTEVSE